MEEQAADVEVTVKTLDSQSRTYTVAPQVNSTATTKTSFQSLRVVVVVFLHVYSITSIVDCQGVQGIYCTFSGYPCGQTEADLPRKGLAG